METQDFITLLIAVAALVLSATTFYLQRIRKKDKLLGRLLSLAITEAPWWGVAEYAISNVGDTQLAVSNARLIGESGKIHQTKNDQTPFVIKPGEVVIVFVRYMNFSEENVTMQFGAYSARGRTYRLSHKISDTRYGSSGAWEIFTLKRSRSTL